MRLKTGDLVRCDTGTMPSLYGDAIATNMSSYLCFMEDDDVAIVVAIVDVDEHRAHALLLVPRLRRVAWCPGTAMLCVASRTTVN